MKISKGLAVAAFVLSSLYIAAPAMATKIDKAAIKSTCSTAGGSYSEGSNYARCEYSNGDSYTCNTDVNQCESCTRGNCTVEVKRPGGMTGIKPGPATNAPASSPTRKPGPLSPGAPTNKAK